MNRKQIPLSAPIFSGNEWDYVKDCLDSGWVSSVGSYVDKFEHQIRDYIGSDFATATVNGTSALHLSLLACGIQPGDEVIVPTLTFIAPVNVVRYCQAIPVFMDCCIEHLGIDVDKITEFVEKSCEMHDDGCCYNILSKRRIKAIIPVHVFGHPVDMDPLLEISSKYNIKVIEDATESLGSEYRNHMTGALGDVGCFSFNGNKIITSGGGGMIVSNDESLALKTKHLSTQAKSDAFYYDHDAVGYNYRLSNILAAVGLAQVERIKEFVLIKRKNAEIYRGLFSGFDGIEFLWERSWAKSNFWFYTLKVPKNDKEPLIKFLISNGIQVRPIWKLMHTLSVYENFQSYNIEKAVDLHDSCINLPCSLDLSEEDISEIVSVIKKYFDRTQCQ